MDQVNTPQFEMIAGQLALDLANTVGGLRGAVSQDNVHTYADLVAWAQQAGIVTESRARQLQREAGQRATEAGSVFARAVTLREAIYRVFSNILQGKQAASADLEMINDEVARALTHARIVLTANGYTWSWIMTAADLDQMLWPVAHSAADLLTSPDLLSNLRECQSVTCGWLFVDTTRNHSRRWCDMKGCGNRAKVRRFREKQ